MKRCRKQNQRQRSNVQKDGIIQVGWLLLLQIFHWFNSIILLGRLQFPIGATLNCTNIAKYVWAKYVCDQEYSDQVQVLGRRGRTILNVYLVKWKPNQFQTCSYCIPGKLSCMCVIAFNLPLLLTISMYFDVRGSGRRARVAV